MPVYNENIKELKQSIMSIMNQTYKNFDLIIINDNPQRKQLTKYLNIINNSCKNIHIINNEKNIGPSLSSNKGILFSNSKFIARMDADDVNNENRLFFQLRFIKKYNLDCICSNFKGFNKFDDINEEPPYYGEKDIMNQNRIKMILSKSNIAMGPTLFFRRSAFLNINGYRDILAEDYDLVTRLIIRGYRIGYQSAVLLYKRNRENNLSNNKALNEFLITYFISRKLKNSNYKYSLSVKELNRLSNKITENDKKSFIQFKIYFNKFKDKRSFVYLFKAILSTFKSSLVFRRNIWMLFINKVNNHNV